MKFLKAIKFKAYIGLLLIGLSATSCTSTKHIYINKKTQTLTAYEGSRVFLISPVSTGKSTDPTPNGIFTVGIKEKMHYSNLYDNAPMPYSVQFFNNYFIHGGSLPGYPASHGCVRMPNDYAKKLFKWVTPGTPVIIRN